MQPPAVSAELQKLQEILAGLNFTKLDETLSDLAILINQGQNHLQGKFDSEAALQEKRHAQLTAQLSKQSEQLETLIANMKTKQPSPRKRLDDWQPQDEETKRPPASESFEIQEDVLSAVHH